MKTKKWISALLLAILLACVTLSTALAFKSERLTSFPIITDDNILVADANTRVVTVIKQDPVTKLITATVQAQNNSSGAVKLEIEAFSIELSFNGSVAPYAYDPTITKFDPALLWYGEIRNGHYNGVETKPPIFNKYCKTLYSVGVYEFDGLGNQTISSVEGYGGFISTRVVTSSSGSAYLNLRYVVVESGQSIDIAEFYFMPVNGSSELSLDMFSFKYEYLWSGFLRITNYIASGTYFVEGVDKDMPPENRYYMINPNTFKMHVQHAKPNVFANYDAKAVTNYDSATMEWSNDGGITYRSDVLPIINDGDTIYVRAKGDADYSGNDPLYANYKKYIASEPVILVFDGNGGSTYSVTFYGNGGMPLQLTLPIQRETAFGAGNMPSEPTRDGYKFDGWNTSPNGTGTPFSETTIVNSNMQVYAQWKDSTKTAVEVTFDPNCDAPFTFNGATTKIVYVDDEYGTLPGKAGAWSVTRPGGFGYELRLYCWDLIDGLSPSQNGVVTEDTIVTKETDHSLYAKWERVTLFQVYTIAFDGNNGIPELQIRNVEKDRTVLERSIDENGVENKPIEEPTRTASTFLGWNTSRDGTGTWFQVSSSTVPANMRVYAQYKPAVECCYVTFDSNGGEPQTPIEVIVVKGFAVGSDDMPANPSFTNKTFDGWNTEQDGSGDPFDENTPVPVDITVYAQWLDEPPEMCTVTFHGNQGNSETLTHKDVAKGSALGDDMPADPPHDPADPTHDDGYVFYKWNTAPDGTGDDFDKTMPVNDDMEVYALWTTPKYKVTFDDNYPDGLQFDVYVNVNTAMGADMPVQPSRSGYKFLRWDTRQDGKGFEFKDTTTVDRDYTVYAQWEYDPTQPDQYIVTFDSNYAGGPSQNDVPVPANTAIGTSIPTPNRPGNYIFVRWDTMQDGTGLEFTEATIVTKDLTVYAQWAEKCTVTFDGSPGKFDGIPGTPAIQTKSVAKGTALGFNSSGLSNMPPSPTRSGYWFVQWNDSAGVQFTVQTIVDKDITVYAQWQPIPPGGNPGGGGAVNYTVTFNNNDGTNTTQTRTVESGSIVGNSAMPADPTRSEFIFTGWNTSMDGTGTVFTAATVVTANTYVYAQWAPGNPDVPGFITEHIPYIFGYPDNTVRPDSPITRAEAATIFFRLLSSTSKDIAMPVIFNDVAEGLWYTQPVSYLASIGILTGYPDGSFRPNQPITRAEFATIASRFDHLEYTESNAFSDVGNHWAKDYINSAAVKGWIDGYPDGTFMPQQSITRAEVVKIVNTMLDRRVALEDIPTVGIRTYSDIGEGHWAYTHIMEASHYHDFMRKADGNEIWTLK